MYGFNGVSCFILAQNDTFNFYYYRKNLQGDITHIVDSYGSTKAAYIYDAWGNHKAFDASGTMIYDSKTGAIAGYENHIANINPFRYRGYYYDVETNLYYLKSRYYDPEVGRFINADDIGELREDRINGLNLYTYCGNNPVMNIDPNGNAFFTIFLLTSILIGAALVGGYAGYTAYQEGYRGWELAASIAGGVLMGGAMGAQQHRD